MKRATLRLQITRGDAGAESPVTWFPQSIEQTPRGERAFDLYSRLLKDRIVILGSQVDDDSANLIVAQLLHLSAGDPDKEISLYINSPGGSKLFLGPLNRSRESMEKSITDLQAKTGQLEERNDAREKSRSRSRQRDHSLRRASSPQSRRRADRLVPAAGESILRQSTNR